jgi:uncharacterized protein YoxC
MEGVTPDILTNLWSFWFLCITFYLLLTRFFKQIDEIKETLELMKTTLEAQTRLNEKLLEKVLSPHQ